MSEENFDRIAELYDDALPAHVVAHYLEKRVRFINDLNPGDRILDVGCGTGAIAERLSNDGFNVTGVDPSRGMLDVMEARAPQVEAVHASGNALPFADESFDLTLSVATFHHIAEAGAVRETLAEMVRVTAAGGRILIWDHNPRNPYWRFLMARVPQDDGSERLIPEREIHDGLDAAGCREFSSTQLGFVPDFVPARMIRPAARIETLVEATPGVRRLCAHNVVLAKRG